MTKEEQKKDLMKYPKEWIIDELIHLLDEIEDLEKQIVSLKRG